VWLDILNKIKKESGMTLDQIIDKSGVSKGTVNKIFAGQTKDPQLSSMKAIVHSMGYTLDDLNDDPIQKVQVNDGERELLTKFHKLNEIGRKAMLITIEGLLSHSEFTNK
jgi:transcriptional regulator with XRE-family HTH domain